MDTLLDQLPTSLDRDRGHQSQFTKYYEPQRADSTSLVMLPEPNHSDCNMEHEVDLSNPIQRAEYFKSITQEGSVKNLRFPPPTVLLCANVQAERYSTCDRPGTMTCTDCRLVSYCSRECQRMHWRKHKIDCKNGIRSDSWVPQWTRDDRLPSIAAMNPVPSGGSPFGDDQHIFANGLALWGSTPAVDVINQKLNEEKPMGDFTLAFVASGDLGDILKTINNLREDYSGKLTILANDPSSVIVCRNIVLLLILGTIEDKVLAADIALHSWYSAFLPTDYRHYLSWVIRSFINEIRKEEMDILPLGPTSSLSCAMPRQEWFSFFHFISSSMTMETAQTEYDRVRNAPSRCDFRDRMYAGLKPSHRAAFQQYRRFGIILPFGAINAHFNWPNQSLFSANGTWWQTDYADPLGGWDITTVIAVGKKYGVQPEDIYGCLYFFLSQELRTFAERIQKFDIRFSLCRLNPDSNLPTQIRDGALLKYGIPKSIEFDRISISNILESSGSVDMEDVLLRWTPFLSSNTTAAIIGMFMNWTASERKGLSMHADPTVVTPMAQKNIEKTARALNIPCPMSVETLKNMATVFAGSVDAFYDNSIPFLKFLCDQGLEEILRKTKLKLRMKHTIVPHRIYGPLQGEPEDLPVFLADDDESWYYHTKLTSYTWSERYVEFIRHDS